MKDKDFNDFQYRVLDWTIECFGETIPFDKAERNYRFLEEALELVQACGLTKEDALRLVDYVFDRPLGDIHQEIGGVTVTLAALCTAHDRDMAGCAEIELSRVREKIAEIRAKQAAKKIKSGPLP